jgi:hypothetical protein
VIANAKTPSENASKRGLFILRSVRAGLPPSGAIEYGLLRFQ